jgi:hypothetical protein
MEREEDTIEMARRLPERTMTDEAQFDAQSNWTAEHRNTPFPHLLVKGYVPLRHMVFVAMLARSLGFTSRVPLGSIGGQPTTRWQ